MRLGSTWLAAVYRGDPDHALAVPIFPPSCRSVSRDPSSSRLQATKSAVAENMDLMDLVNPQVRPCMHSAFLLAVGAQ